MADGHDGSPALPATGAVARDLRNSSAARILVVDDEPQIRRFLDIGLRAQGYRVALAATGAAGLAELATQGADLVILDLGLPDRDGHAVLADLTVSRITGTWVHCRRSARTAWPSRSGSPRSRMTRSAP